MKIWIILKNYFITILNIDYNNNNKIISSGKLKKKYEKIPLMTC